MQHLYDKSEISIIDWNPIEDIISIGDIRNVVILWSLKSPEYPIYYSKCGINPIIDMKWICECKLVFCSDGGGLYALSFASEIVRPKPLYNLLFILFRISIKSMEMSCIDCLVNNIYCCGDDGNIYYYDISNIHKNKSRSKDAFVPSFQHYLSVGLAADNPICPFPSVGLNNISPIMNKYSSDNGDQQIYVKYDKDVKLIFQSKLPPKCKVDPQILYDYRKSVIRLHCTKKNLIYESRNGLFVVVPYD